MAESSKLQVLIDLQVKNQRAIEDLEKKLSKTGDITKSLNSSFGSFLLTTLKLATSFKIASKVISTFSESLSSAIARVDSIQNFPVIMKGLGQSATSSQKAIDYLSQALIGLPTTLDSAVSAVQRFTSINGSVETSTVLFEAVNHALLSGASSMDKQATALEQLSQMYGNNKVDMMSWRSVNEAIPAQLKQIATALKLPSTSALYEAMKTGTVSMDKFMDTIVQLDRKGLSGFDSFAKQATNSTMGISTSLTNLSTAFTRATANIINAIGRSNIVAVIQLITNAVNKLGTALASVISLFMGVFGFSSGASKGLSDVSDSVDDISSGFGDVAKSTDEATGSANKYLRALQGFDKMNSISKKTDSGSGDVGSGGSSLNYKIPDFSKPTTDLSGLLEKLDIDTIAQAFRNLAIEIGGLFSTLGEMGGFVWTNALQPLLLWATNNVLPTVVDALAVAFSLLNTVLSTLASIFEPVWLNIIKPLGEFIGAILNPVLEGMRTSFEMALESLSGVRDVLLVMKDNFNEFLTPVKEWIGKATEWVEQNKTLTTVLEAFGKALGILATGIGIVTGLIAVWNAVMVIANVVGGIFAGIWAIITSPITLVILAVAAVIAIIILLYENWESISAFLVESWNWISEQATLIWNAIATFFQNLWNSIKEFAINTWNTIKEKFSNIWKSIKDFFSDTWDNIKTIASTGINIVKDVIETIMNTIRNIFSTVWNAITSFINSAITTIQNIITAVFTTIQSIITSILSTIRAVFTSIWNSITSFVSTTIENIKNKFINGFNTIKDGITNIMNGISQTVGNIAQGLVALIKTPINAIINLINKAIDGLNSIHVDIPDWVPGLGGKSFGINLPHIPELAEGGIITAPTIALIGEAGDEAVVPLDQYQNNKPQTIVIKIGEETIAEKIIEAINGRSQQLGYNLLTV